MKKPQKPKIDKSLCEECQLSPKLKKHTCPFKAEIQGNDKKCNCCKTCEYNCSQEI